MFLTGETVTGNHEKVPANVARVLLIVAFYRNSTMFEFEAVKSVKYSKYFKALKAWKLNLNL